MEQIDEKKYKNSDQKMDKKLDKKIAKPKQSAHKKKKLSKSFYTKIFMLLGVCAILFTAYNTLQVSSLDNSLSKQISDTKEATRPAEIQIMFITTECADCFDIQSIKSIVSGLRDVIITSEKEISFESQEGKDAVEKYAVQRVPSVIIKGELDRSKTLQNSISQYATRKEDYFLVDTIPLPYVNTASGKTEGLVKATILKHVDCTNCSDMNTFLNQLEESGVVITEKVEEEASSQEAKRLISEYKIDKLPTVILSKDLEAYTEIAQNWESVGAQKEDGSFILHTTNPPYYSLEENRVVGGVTLTAIDDNACDECYDPLTVHKGILNRMGLLITEEISVDATSAEGKAFILKYEIESIPTVILQGDIGEYANFEKVWNQVGTVEDDGTYVFREIGIIKQIYKDLVTGEIVQVQS